MPPQRFTKAQLAELVVLATEVDTPDTRLTWRAHVPALGTMILREIDVLVESTVAGARSIRTIEVRERSRPANIEWVDAAIGKAQVVGAEQVTLVSAAGFSKNALRQIDHYRPLLRAFSLRASTPSEWPFTWAEPKLDVRYDDGELLSVKLDTLALCEEPGHVAQFILFVGVHDVQDELMIAVGVTRPRELFVPDSPNNFNFRMFSPDRQRVVDVGSITMDLDSPQGRQRIKGTPTSIRLGNPS